MDYMKKALLIIGGSSYSRPINDVKIDYRKGEKLKLICADEFCEIADTEVNLRIVDIEHSEKTNESIYIMKPSEEEEREEIKTACFKSKNWRTISHLPPRN
ncbi:MAG: hypothetical protein U9M94_03535 [Patescibacteria group bacterium]|nr:hypothetical protein [Patescibacteria group bacterium]